MLQRYEVLQGLFYRGILSFENATRSVLICYIATSLQPNESFKVSSPPEAPGVTVTVTSERLATPYGGVRGAAQAESGFGAGLPGKEL